MMGETEISGNSDDPRGRPWNRPLALPRVEWKFGHPGRRYQPTEWLTVDYAITGLEEERLRAFERSIVWYTEGKGEEDMGVHFFERFVTPGTFAGAVPEGSFAVQLPASPSSYEGVIVKIRWCVRVRVFFESGRDHVAEQVFTVGDVPPTMPP